LSQIGTILWDFETTLGERVGGWTETCVETARMFEVDIDPESIRPYMKSGLPWHEPETFHGADNDADAWWRGVHAPLERAFLMGAGIEPSLASTMATEFRHVYLRPGPWRLYDETLEVLGVLREMGWKHVILSNHVPELPEILSFIGLEGQFEAVVCSAQTGWEKPNPEAFKCGLTHAIEGKPVWMIGDNPVADFEGAQAVGIPAILVRREGCQVERFAKDLWWVLPYLSP